MNKDKINMTDEQLTEIIKRQFTNHNFYDRYDLKSLQFDYWDMISFASNVLRIYKEQSKIATNKDL